MDRKKRDLIENLVQIIRTEQSVSCPVENIGLLVRSLGGELSFSNDPLLLGGRVCRLNDKNRSFRIEVSIRLSEKKKRLAAAQELGHLFIHMGYLYNPEIWEQQKAGLWYQRDDSEKEYEASAFAESLLMPEAELRACIEAVEGSQVSLSEVSEYFGVPVQTALYRCISLKLVEGG